MVLLRLTVPSFVLWPTSTSASPSPWTLGLTPVVAPSSSSSPSAAFEPLPDGLVGRRLRERGLLDQVRVGHGSLRGRRGGRGVAAVASSRRRWLAVVVVVGLLLGGPAVALVVRRGLVILLLDVGGRGGLLLLLLEGGSGLGQNTLGRRRMGTDLK